MKMNEGLPIPVVAVHPDGKIARFDSKTEAASFYGVSLQYVHKCSKENPLRAYQAKTLDKRPIRFCLASDNRWKELVQQNKSLINN